MTNEARDLFVSASDGLRLYARDEGPAESRALPVVCLPGLTRNSTDFAKLSAALASDPERPRRVLSLDYRGRGRSDWDPDWRRYDVRVELEDVLQVLAAAGIAEAVFVGTSRGGLIIMGLGAIRPALLRGAVLNDIGPVIEARGLERIRSYVGKLPKPKTFGEAVEIMKRISGGQFPRWGDVEWEDLARGTWHEAEEGLVLTYDPDLMRTLEALDLNAPPPTLWPLFEGLKPVPVLVVRGANSDILSAETADRMRASHPNLDVVTVPDQGHAPSLDGDLIPRVAAFIRAAEDTNPERAAV